MYEEAIAIDPRDVEPYYKVGELLELKAPAKAAEVSLSLSLSFFLSFFLFFSLSLSLSRVRSRTLFYV